MKKKVIALCLVIALAAIAVIGGTMAYFTDTDEATNVFTVGEVKIALHEENKAGDKDEAYQAWLAEQTLVPTTKAKVENTIDKIVTVENTGNNDAYMWIEVWVPSALDDGDDNSPAAPGLGNSLHFNFPANVTESKSTLLGSKTIDGVAYNGYVHFIKGSTPIAKGESTTALLDQVYMDAKVQQAEGGLLLADGTTVYDGTWELKINAIGMQADGFDTIEAAIGAYYNVTLANYLWN